MNWAQVIAAIIISTVTLVNLFYTIKSSKEKEKNELKRKYVERQSDALESWWLLTMKPEYFKSLKDEDQDNLIRHLIWLPADIKESAYAIINLDEPKSRDALRKKINSHLVNMI